MACPAGARAQRTAADLESARQLYNQGIELRDRGDVAGAREKFKAAHALGNTPLTGLELCKAHASLGQPVEAREVCLGVGRIPPLAQETPRSQDARREASRIAEEVKPKIGGLRVKILGVPQGREPTVTVDGVAIPAAALGEPRAVNPGQHVVTARVGGGAETRATLDTREGEFREVELTVQPPPPGEVAPPPQQGQQGPVAYQPPPPREKKNTFATVSFVVGGVAAGVGLVTGILALSAKGDLDDKCPQNACGREDWDELDSAKRMGNVSTAMFVVAGVAVGAGLISLAATSSRSGRAPARPAKVTPILGVGGAGIHGAF